jgi:PAS domain S-box-containing protein
MSANTIPESTGNLTQAPQTQRFAAVSLGPASHSDPINILIVDDEPKNLTVLETVLQDPGYRLVRAESGEQALLALVEEEFALLILDIRMPGMTGFELAHMIKQRKKTAGVPIIFLTAYYNEDQHVLEGYGTGAVDYLQKPVNPTILRSKVAIFAELHRRSREHAIINRVLFAEVTERRRAEDQLRELNDTLEHRVVERTDALLSTRLALDETSKRYRSLVDDSLDAIFSLGVDQRFEAANPAALRLTARTLEELKIVRFLDLCAPDQREALENAFRAVCRRENITLDTTFVTPTGERRDLFISATPAMAGGEVVGVSCIARDVTERKQAQEAVQQSEARLSGIISSAMDAIITINQTERITDFNTAAEQMFGCAAGEAVGQPIDRFIPKRSWTMHGRHAESSGLTHVTNPLAGALGTIYGRHTNGEEFPIEAAISESRIREEKYYTVILRDMSERVEQETALRLSEARYRDLIQAIPAAIYTCDALGRVTLYNEAAVELWGVEPTIDKTQWCGSWKISSTDGVPMPLDQCPMAVTLREGRPVRGQELVIERPDGTRRHVLPHPQPMLDAGGAVVGAVNMLVDITERKQAEQAIANLAAIVTSSDDAIVGKNLSGIVTSWNRGAERLFGYTGEEMIGQSVTRLIPTERLDEERHILGRIRQGESIDHYETIRRHKDGTELVVSLTVSPVFDSHGKIIGASKIARNITAQKRIEEALRRSERDLSDFFDNASIGLHWVGPDDIIMKVNQTELDMFGYSREEYVGRPITEFHVDQPGIRNILDRLAAGETLHEYPAKIRCKDGSVRDVLVNSNVLFDEGKFIHTRCFTRDVTDRNRAEQALVESRKELQRALEFEAAVVTSMGEGLYTVDGQGLVTSINQAAEKLFGWTSEELLGRKMHDMTHYKHQDGTPYPAEECAGFRVLQGGKPLTNHEDVFIRKDGSFFDVLYSSSPILAGGKVVGLVVVFRDISDRKRAENAILERDRALTAANEALRKQTAALADVNKELEGFSYSVSHDLRAPLRTIDAFSRILEEDHAPHLNAEANRCLTIVRRAAGQAGELIDDLLEFSRLGRQDMSVHVVKMTGLAREAADELILTQNGRQMSVIVGELPPCEGDLRLLKLVWNNLLSNAFKYTKHKNECRIEVGWMPDDHSPETVTYYVKDDGIGFDMKYAHKLFGVFQRLHRKEDFEGTGVGLANVQRIVQRHGGRVWAEGKVNGGATFYFSLRKASA